MVQATGSRSVRCLNPLTFRFRGSAIGVIASRMKRLSPVRRMTLYVLDMLVLASDYPANNPQKTSKIYLGIGMATAFGVPKTNWIFPRGPPSYLRRRQASI